MQRTTDVFRIVVKVAVCITYAWPVDRRRRTGVRTPEPPEVRRGVRGPAGGHSWPSHMDVMTSPAL